MSEFKGTTGEWRISNDFTQITVSKKGVLEGSKKVCDMSCFSKSENEVKYNAILISKAPEMLDMLEEIYGKYEKDGHLLNVSPSIIKQLITEATNLK